MKVLIACEFSGVVRRAFAERGHDAWSCDLLPSMDGSDKHIQADARTVLDRGWDLMVAHPPCTYLCNSGVRWMDKGTNGARMAFRLLACELFNDLLGEGMFSAAFAIPRIAVENPIQHTYARERIRKQDQIIQPWQFGHGETKATCLWLKGLPPPCANRHCDGSGKPNPRNAAVRRSREAPVHHLSRHRRCHG